MQYKISRESTVQYSTVQYSTVQYSTVQYSTVQYSTVWYGTVRYLRNRKHAPCSYRVIETRVEVWEKEKCCGNKSCRRVFSQLFRVLPNFHECFYNSLETRRTCFLFLLENAATKKGKQLNAPSLRQQLVLVLCFYRVIETRFLTTQRAYFLRTVFFNRIQNIEKACFIVLRV